MIELRYEAVDWTPPVGERRGARRATIHTLHYYLTLAAEIREAVAAGAYPAWSARFREDRARSGPPDDQ